MMNAEQVVMELTRRGEMMETAPGLVLLRGDTLRLFHWLEASLRDLGIGSGAAEWRVPEALSLQTLDRADYFTSFPQWLTTAAHLSDDVERLEQLAGATDRATGVQHALEPPACALQPALCYHVYAALADRTLHAPVCVTCEGTCWRHEGDRHSPLERGWAFTMREIVHVAGDAAVTRFLAQQRAAAVTFAHRLGLVPGIEPAADPFFAPTARGRAALQRVKGLKDELMLPLGGGRYVAAASFNHHERFFGDAFSIMLADGSSAVTGCAAYGIERWLLACLVSWGVAAADWPVLNRDEPTTQSPPAARALAG